MTCNGPAPSLMDDQPDCHRLIARVYENHVLSLQLKRLISWHAAELLEVNGIPIGIYVTQQCFDC